MEKIMPGANLNTFAPTADTTPCVHRQFPNFRKGSSIIVIGAGAFGGWSALYLLRKGYKVTLVDAWGPGNSRSSSGDETRVIRSTYGSNETYFDLNVRALELWKENQLSFGDEVFINTGVLWFCYEDKTPLVDDSIPFATKHNMAYEYLTREAVRKKYPAINTDDLHHAYYDPYGGYLKARTAVQHVRDAFINEGGTYLQREVLPGTNPGSGIRLSDGTELKASAYLFACGSWLGELFPHVLGTTITCTKQEVYYFGAPQSDSSSFENLPVWVDVDGKDFYYGIPGNTHRGFKIGVDPRGEVFNPTSGERTITPEVLRRAREFVAHRFPKLANAPLLEHRICPYENSPNGNFIFDLIPGTENVFVLGGGSGHGFKHGPALGELVADVLSGTKIVPELFYLPENQR
jgi:glycine/D-amino acid oxidase-like deaminating enzyme